MYCMSFKLKTKSIENMQVVMIYSDNQKLIPVISPPIGSLRGRGRSYTYQNCTVPIKLMLVAS